MSRTSLPIIAVSVGLLAACVGSIGDNDGSFGGAGDGTGSSSAACSDGKLHPGRAPIRRMTRVEFDNTVHDLLGTTQQLGHQFAPEEVMLGFDNNADALTMSSLLSEQIMDAAEKLSTEAVSHLAKIAPTCDWTGDDLACAKQFATTFGKRAYRRALTDDEVADLVGIYTKGKTGGSYQDGVSLMIQRLLQSPFFLFRVERGDPSTLKDGAMRLTGYETASRLSYFLWNSMPDDQLISDAEAGNLDSKEGVEAAARRMVNDPRAKSSVANFHNQWLELTNLDTITKDATMFPEFDDTLRASLKKETQTFVDDVFWNKGTYQDLLLSPYTFVDTKLAGFYGIDAPSGSGLVKVTTDPSKRAGILTQGSLLAIRAKPNQSSPIHRGKFVREKLLCMSLPPPPADLKIVPPDLNPKLSTRERYSQHDTNPACAGCHTLMDPIGFGFEHYDAIGRWRDSENGIPVDATGKLLQTQDIDGPFDGVRDLAQRLAKSKQVEACMVTQWFRYAYGRGESEADSCSLATLNDAFAKSGGDMRELLVALTLTDAFRYRAVINADGTEGM